MSATTLTINGTDYRIDRPLATKAIALHERIVRLLGPGAAGLAEAFVARGDDSKSDAAAADGFAAMIRTSEPGDMAALLKELVGMGEVKNTNGDWVRIDMDAVFTDRPADLYPVAFAFGRKVVAPFIDAGLASKLRAATDRLSQAAKSES